MASAAASAALDAIPDKTKNPTLIGYPGEGPLKSDRFHGNDANNFWVYPADKKLKTPQWDTHFEAKKFCTNCKEVSQDDGFKCFKCLGHNPGEGDLNSDGFHGTDKHKFWVYPTDKTLVDPKWDTHLEAKKFCTNCKVVNKGEVTGFECLGHKGMLGAGKASVKGLEDALNDSSIPGLSKDRVVKGTDKLFKWLFKKAASAKSPGGIGEMLFAHIDAPMKAFGGDGEGAVNSAMAGVGAVTTGIIVGSFAGPVGAVVGAVVGHAIAKGPGAVISHFDTSQVQYTIQITNYTNHNVYLDRGLKSYSSSVDSKPRFRMQGTLAFDSGAFNFEGRNHDRMIPGARLIHQKDGSVKVGFWTWLITVKSKQFTSAFRFIASNKTPMLHEVENTREWWMDRSAVQHSWAVGFQAPGKSLFGGMYQYHASCDGAKGDGAPNHKDAYDNMRMQGKGNDAGNGANQKSRFNTKKGVSTCYWKKESGDREWTSLVVDLYD